MKLFRIFIPALFAFVLIMSSCDKLDPPYATVKTEYDTTNKPFVLLEDYTGHRCNNCPLATMQAHKMVEYYKKKVVLIAVHATDLADPNVKYTLDLRTTDGTQWAANFSLSYVPQGLVNRATYANIFPVSPDAWNKAIEVQLNKPIATYIKATAVVNSTSKEISVAGDVLFKKTLAAGAKICYYIVEDSIIGLQSNKDPEAGTTPDIQNYVYMHALRGSMNGVYGETLTTTAEAEKKYTFSKKFTVTNSEWNVRHLSLITVILDPSATQYGEVIGVNDAVIKPSK